MLSAAIGAGVGALSFAWSERQPWDVVAAAGLVAVATVAPVALERWNVARTRGPRAARPDHELELQEIRINVVAAESLDGVWTRTTLRCLGPHPLERFPHQVSLQRSGVGADLTGAPIVAWDDAGPLRVVDEHVSAERRAFWVLFRRPLYPDKRYTYTFELRGPISGYFERTGGYWRVRPRARTTRVAVSLVRCPQTSSAKCRVGESEVAVVPLTPIHESGGERIEITIEDTREAHKVMWMFA
jgi:hypothetical protein